MSRNSRKGEGGEDDRVELCTGKYDRMRGVVCVWLRMYSNIKVDRQVSVIGVVRWGGVGDEMKMTERGSSRPQVCRDDIGRTIN